VILLDVGAQIQNPESTNDRGLKDRT